MPRKEEPSFPLKQIIWDIAATVGTENYSAIDREVDRRLEALRRKGEIFEDTPDPRKIKDIIELDIQRLTQEAVIDKLPRHVWSLRNDYEDIKALAEKEEAQKTAMTNKPWEEHIAEINNLLDKLRECLFNNHVELSPKIRLQPLEFEGRDWRLVPLTWARIVTPSLRKEDKELWEEDYQLLFSHLEGSAFMKHYDEFFQKAETLDKAYEEAIKRVAESDQKLLHSWQMGRKKTNPYSTFINLPSLGSDFSKVGLGFSPELTEKIIRKLVRDNPSIIDQLVELEMSLDQLNKDLKPKYIKSVLEKGHCKECPSSE